MHKETGNQLGRDKGLCTGIEGYMINTLLEKKRNTSIFRNVLV